jgi:hypothetical protein
VAGLKLASCFLLSAQASKLAKSFASEEAAENWFEENDFEGVAFEYGVLFASSLIAPGQVVLSA